MSDLKGFASGSAMTGLGEGGSRILKYRLGKCLNPMSEWNAVVSLLDHQSISILTRCRTSLHPEYLAVRFKE